MSGGQEIYLPIIAPFFPEDILQNMLVHICMDAIDKVIRRHDRPWVRLPHSNLKWLEIQLPQGSFPDNRIYRQSVRLLFIPDEICFICQLYFARYSKLNTNYA